MSAERSIIDITRMDITEYTEYEFEKLLEYVVECYFSNAWQREAMAMLEKVVKYPNVGDYLREQEISYFAYQEIKAWYEEQGLPFVKPDVVKPVTDYTETEFMALLQKTQVTDESNCEETDYYYWLYCETTEYPEPERLMHCVDTGEPTPEGVLARIKAWYAENNKPLFKPE